MDKCDHGNDPALCMEIGCLYKHSVKGQIAKRLTGKALR